jgi:hypothetical protein
MKKIKNKKYYINLEVPFDLWYIIDIFNEEAHNNPDAFAELMIKFGHDGDWSLELAYLKLLKKDINSDYGKKTADLLQQVIDIIEKNEEN